MKSRTSYSKLTTFKKDLTRFAPIWALYLIGAVLVINEQFNYGRVDTRASSIPDIIMVFGVVNLIYAGVCALMLYGDLYNTRMCYSLHALPQRRESWLVSHFGAGILYSLVPNLAIMGLMMARLGSYASLAPLWLLASEMQFLFFFGLASVAAMLTGNRLGMGLVYLGLNFVSLLVYWIIETVYLPQINGVLLNTTVFSLLCPAIQMTYFEYMEFQYVTTVSSYSENVTGVWEYCGCTNGWGYMAILAALGLVLMLVAVWLYRKRHLESAGDFVAFPKLKGFMCVAMTLCAGGAMAYVGEEIFNDSLYLWLAVGLVVGYFGSLMLLERRLKVFRKRSLLCFAVLMLLLIGSFVLVALDAFGIESWVPTASQVESVTVSNSVPTTNYYFGGADIYYTTSSKVQVTLEDQEDIQNIIDAHQSVLDWDGDINGRYRVTFTYKLKNGRTVIRTYMAATNSDSYRILSEYLYTTQNILGYTNWADYVASMQYMDVGGEWIPEELYESLLEAIRADCENGHVTTSYTSGCFYVSMYWNGGEESGWRDICIATGAEKTLTLLRTPEFVMGYTDWEEFLTQVESCSVDGYDITDDQLPSLMEALRADCEAGALSLIENWSSYQYAVSYQIGDHYRYLVIPAEAENTVTYLEALFNK